MASANRVMLLAFLCLLKISGMTSNTNNVWGSTVRSRHFINVSENGLNDPVRCVTASRGCSLAAAFVAATSQDEFKNSTTIVISEGNYNLKSSYTFQTVSNLTITGVSTNVRIQCSGNDTGLAFIRCADVEISNVSLMTCGALRNSSSYGKPLFVSGIFVRENMNFRLQNVVIERSPGIGMTMYDTKGVVQVQEVRFEKNGPNSLKCESSKPLTKKAFGSSRELAKAGGGLYIEFTYGESSGSSLNDSSYHITKSKFIENVAPYSGLSNDTFKQPGKMKHVGFSRGGGLSIYIRGYARGNVFNINSCQFEGNEAIWGGGYYVQFLDDANGNTIKISNVNVTNNLACLGGGGFQISMASSIQQAEKHVMPNNIYSVMSRFVKNSAVSGGGGAIFGKTNVANADNGFHFENCTWLRNKATIGFAMTLKLSDYDKGLFGPNSPFKVNLSNCHIIANKLRNVSRFGWGVGTLYDFLTPLFLENVTLTENTNTSLVLDTSSVWIVGTVKFERNTGYKGGAVAMYGEASFQLSEGSKLIFDGNVARERGGAIFVETPGPDSLPVVGNNYLQTHECFFKYADAELHPDQWSAEVVFIDNEAPYSAGYSVYSNSLSDCVRRNENFSKVLEWKSFHYFTRQTLVARRSYEIATDAVQVLSKKADWFVPPSQAFSPQITLLDEKNNLVYGVVNVSIETDNKTSVTLGTPSSLFLVKDKIPLLQLKGKSSSNFSVDVRTVSGQFAQQKLKNVQLRRCNPGFVPSGGECVCASGSAVRGISRCSDEETILYLQKGYWAGEVTGKNGLRQFVTTQCPARYCKCNKRENLSMRADECVFVNNDMCTGNRDGVLCGSCADGLSVEVGVQTCSSSCKNSDLWKLAPLLLFLTVLVFVIFFVNLDLFTCYLNVWLYFYQVVHHVIGVHGEITLDPFISFIIGLGQVTISGFGSCFWKGMNNLQKLAFSYLLPGYVFLVVSVISLMSRRYPDSYFSRHSTFRASCTLIVLCYSTLTRVSMDILRPAAVGDRIVVFFQGTVAYFGAYHCYFAVPALVVLFLIVIPFPFILMFTPFFTRRVCFVVYATPLFNTFQSCFSDGRRWYAAFYFFCRFFLLLFSTFIPYGTVKALFMQISCAAVLTAHMYLWPYSTKYNWMNRIDAILLATLTAISILAAQATNNISEKAKKGLTVLIDVLAYLPLCYLLVIVIYFARKSIKRRLPQEVVENQHAVNDAAVGVI